MGWFLAFLSFLPILSKDLQRVMKVFGFEWYFFLLRFKLPGLLINSWSSLLGWHQRVLKERGTISEIQRAKLFGDLVSLRYLLQIAFPELREIISVTLVAVESSPAFFHWCRYVPEMGNHVSSNYSYMYLNSFLRSSFPLKHGGGDVKKKVIQLMFLLP